MVNGNKAIRLYAYSYLGAEFDHISQMMALQMITLSVFNNQVFCIPD
jgi:hypothetical protein